MQTLTTFARRNLWSVANAGLMLALASLSTPAFGQQADETSSDVSVQQQIESMRRELDRVRQENRTMRGEIDELRALNNDQWLTEQRANEIKALVNDVLADADTRASLQDSGMTAGWNEHFFLGSADGRFLLIFEGMEQIRFVFNHQDSPDRWRHGLENTRTYLTFRGHVFDEDVEYLVRGDFARAGGEETLLDGWVRYILDDKWAIRFGQFKLPFNREYLVAEHEQQAVERSLVNETFSPKRSQGVELQYADSVNRWSLALSDGGNSPFTGNNNRSNTPWSAIDTEWAVTSRYERLLAGTWDQFSSMTSPRGDEFGLLAGVALHAEQGESLATFTLGRDENRLAQVTADISAEWGGANLFGAVYYAYLDSGNTSGGATALSEIYGVVVQGGVYVSPKWEVFARAEYGVVDSDELNIEDLQVMTVGVNYYIDGQDLKWSADLSWGFNEVDAAFASDLAGFRSDNPLIVDGPQVVFRTQFQLLF